MNMMWSRLTADNPDVMKDRAVRVYFERVSQILWNERYAASANFVGQNQQNWQALGVFGNMGMWIDEIDTQNGGHPGLRYRSMPPGEIYILQDHQGRVDGCIRYFKRTPRQAYQCWGEQIGPVLRAGLELNSQQLYNFIHVVHPRTDWSPWELLTPRGCRYCSCYIAIEDRQILEEGGYRRLPLAVGRYMQAPDEDYGRGPAQMVLPALKTMNAQKRAFLKQGHLASDPAYLVGDDGLIDFKMHAGAINYGGVGPGGEELVKILKTGDIQVTKEMMDEERNYVSDAFLTTLFGRLLDAAKRAEQLPSARQVIEDAVDRGIFLAPTVGRQCNEYLGPVIDRELDILAHIPGKLPPMPPLLREAKGEYKIVYTSPLARAMRSQEVAGYMQTVEFARDVVNITGDPGLMDAFDFDVALPEIAEIRNVPERWMAGPDKIAAARKQRAQAQERETEVKELPGKAAIIKAQAITLKAQTGGNIGGTLSGTPEGGMPQIPPQNPPGIPGQPSPGPGIPGQPGRPGGGTPMLPAPGGAR
jgi:hypothetical protein